MMIIFNLLQYEDDEGDRVLLATDGDLIGAVSHGRALGQKVRYLFSFAGVMM